MDDDKLNKVKRIFNDIIEKNKHVPPRANTEGWGADEIISMFSAIIKVLEDKK